MASGETEFQRMATQIKHELPVAPQLIVIGSAEFHHHESEQVGEEVAQLLAELPSLSLITGGVGSAGATVGKNFYRKARQHHSSSHYVSHVLPIGARAPNYGRTFHAGDDMFERREILARLGQLFLVIEGGPGTAHEAQVAASLDATLIPVGRSGGVAADLYRDLAPPAWADREAWAELGRELTEVRNVAKAVLQLITAALALNHPA